MRQLYRHILATAVAVMTLAACENEEIEPVTGRNYPTFSAEIDGAPSRAIDDYWEAGDKIGISGAGAINICHVTQTNDTLRVEDPDQQIYFLDSNPVMFTAYYPYNSSRDEITGLINCTTADQANQGDFDFLWATSEGSKSSPVVQFNFTHRMSKISFVFKNGKDMDVSTISRIRLNGIIVEGTFDTTTGICEVNESMTKSMTVMPLTDVKESEPVTPLFIFPQTLTEPLKLEIYAGIDQYFVCNLSVPDNELVAATNYTYTITINKTALKVTDATLSDWITTNGEDSEASSADE